MDRRKPLLPSKDPRYGPYVPAPEEHSMDAQFVLPPDGPGQWSGTRFEQPTTDLDDWPSPPESDLPAPTAAVPSDRRIDTSKWARTEKDEPSPSPRDKGKGKERDTGEQQEPLDEIEAVSDAFFYGLCYRSSNTHRLSWKLSRTARRRARSRSRSRARARARATGYNSKPRRKTKKKQNKKRNRRKCRNKGPGRSEDPEAEASTSSAI